MRMSLPSIPSMVRLYRLLLRLYPADHRREYGMLMEQLFRDQYRKVLNQGGIRSLARLWFADFIISVPSAHLAHYIHAMKTQNVDGLSLKLLSLAVLLSAVAAPMLATAGFASVCLYLSTLALLARAAVEWHRAPEEWLRGLLWMLAMLVTYAIIMPFWVKMHLRHGRAYPSVPLVDAGAVFLNAVIALIRPFINRLGGAQGVK
jgi:hypothetical protein